jgi:hypothetical protein
MGPQPDVTAGGCGSHFKMAAMLISMFYISNHIKDMD